MKFKNKILFDRIVGYPVSFVLNFVSMAVGFILRRDHSIKNLNNKKIAIFKLVGIGSIIEYSPMLKILKNTYPTVKIYFVTSKSNSELMSFFNEYTEDNLFIEDNSLSKLLITSIKIIIRLQREKIDTFINLEVYSSLASLFSLMSLARNRIAFYRKSLLFRKKLDTHLIFFNTQKNIREIYSKTIEVLGCKTDLRDEFPDIAVAITKEDCDFADKFLKENNIVKFIIMNTNASDLMPERRLPALYWIKLINILTNKTNYKILLSGSKSEFLSIEEEIFSRLDNDSKKKVYNIAGKVNLKLFMAFLKKCELFITNDSGPYHLASAIEIPIISLWGPGDSNHYAINRNNKNIIIENKSIYCKPCLYNTDIPPCKGDNVCMKSISINEIIKNIENILKTEINYKEDETGYETKYKEGIITR